ncbi:NADPH:quinone reductase-like Zn-dependent oxidoreductase [Mucilaginibacter frigoritolerans]|uniref:NADPH:quinone reductase-like Zn-dependent oxidoreductase n=1 Tax=Mucilaginibacter frigoritolerans TaxID=652788 RepID=A0A562TSQ8_9SPHI|nr:zinc-dependent alcohol dehydrogenase family protein [Mucilaginibacter frigoritolerans]TWI96649.1 NADPH:quinone reductase-like Zn-dependent oxidoreductase [Mucilaginibacter frigoritolerans]
MSTKAKEVQGIRFHQTGGPEVLKLEKVNVPAPGPQEVRLEVKAIGLNRVDSMFRSGYYSEQPIFPSMLGFEASGIIEAVGAEVKDFATGDSVSVVPAFSNHQYGTYGELILLPAYAIQKNPPNLSFDQAAALWTSYIAVYGMLVDSANLQPGQVVLFNAASSNTGFAITQLVNYLGGISIALTSSASKKQAILNSGAQHVILTGKEDIAKEVLSITRGKGANVILDAVGGKYFEHLVAAAAERAQIFAYGALSFEPAVWPAVPILLKMLSVKGYNMGDLLMDYTKQQAAIAFVRAGVESEKLLPVVGPKFPLSDVTDAHRSLEANQHTGKIILTV